MTKLTRIGLKYNQLEALPGSLQQCVELDELNLENNNIPSLPDVSTNQTVKLAVEPYQLDYLLENFQLFLIRLKLELQQQSLVLRHS